MRKKLLVGLVILAVLVGAPALLAQSGLGNITGRVIDPTGAVIPNAKVVAINNDTRVQAQTVTNGAGIYLLADLIPGTYSVTASAPNFKALDRSNILVQAEDNIGLDMKLEVGSASQTITVTSEQSQLRKEDAQLGEVVTNSMIETLPAISGANGRDPLALLSLAGNVQGDSSNRAGWSLNLAGSLTSGQGDLRINGGRTGALEYLVDGVPATGGFAHNVVNDTPSMDAVQEFKVITNGISAEYGRLSGGLVSVSTKAGTDAFHGQLFEYNQNAYLNSNNWNNDALCAENRVANSVQCTKPNFRRNDFGAAGGGPVIIPHLYDGRRKTFWFANFEGIRANTTGNVNQGQTITDLERTGDLSDIGAGLNDPNDPWPQIWDPYGPVSATTSKDPDSGNQEYTRLQLAGGDGRHIPANELDPIIQKYVALLPHPTPNHSPIAGSTTGGNYLVAQPSVTYSNVWAVRLDQVISEKQRIFGRFSHNYATSTVAPWYPTLGTSTGTLLNGGFGAELHYDYTINPTTILELQTGGNFSPFNTGSFLPKSIQSNSFGYGSTLQSLLGPSDIVRISQGPFTEGTTFGCGSCQYSAGFNGNTGAFVNTTNFVYSASLTKILNKHSLKFGYEGRRYYDNFTQDGQSNQSGGISDGYAFDGEAVTQYIGNNGSEVWSPQGYANGVGQFLLGIDSWIRVTNKLGRSLASNYYAAYLQDDFKVTPSLTLNLGLRWETETPVSERHNNLTVWNPNAAPEFTLSPGFTWAGALGAAGIDPSQVATPSWVTNGFPRGAIQAVSSTEHPSRLANQYHLNNFAPRLGFAFQYDAKTVFRGSFALMYLPTSGNLSSYGDTPGVYYTTTANNQSTQGPPGANTGIYPTFKPRTVANPWDPSQITTFNRNNAVINAQAAASGNGVGAVSIYQHMPHELDWSLGIQRQLPNQWLLELTYSANSSNTLLTLGNPSHFPKSLYTGGPNGVNAALYTKSVPSPTAGQITDNSYTGLNQPLGILEYAYPYYGPVLVEGDNSGVSNYESGNVRVQRRFANGFQLLFNYTFGKAMDDTGGSDTSLGNPGQGTGDGGKTFQQVDSSVKSIYGLSPLDEKHRVSVFYNYQLPFGRGRRFLSDTSTFGGKALDAVVGGWELSGTYLYRSGRPVVLDVQAANVDQAIYIKSTFGSLAPGYTLNQLKNPHPNNLLAPNGVQTPSTPFFNIKALANGGSAASFTYGNLPAAIAAFRNPGNWDSDASFMKSFAFNRDGSMYFQLRLESFNIFNHPGRGSYDANTGDSTFGYIQGPYNVERHLQVGGRFVF